MAECGKEGDKCGKEEDKCGKAGEKVVWRDSMMAAKSILFPYSDLTQGRSAPLEASVGQCRP